MELERPIARFSAAAVVLITVSGLLFMGFGDFERIDPELLAAISAVAGAAAMFLWSPMDRRD